MSLAVVAKADARVEFLPVVEGHRFEELEGCSGIGHAEQRQCRLVLRVTLLVGVARLLFVDMGGVRQQHPEQGLGWWRAEYFARESLAAEPGEIARVVNVGVGQDDRVHRVSRSREWLPVQTPELGRALEETTVDESAEVLPFEQILRSGDASSRTQYSDLHRTSVLILPW